VLRGTKTQSFSPYRMAVALGVVLPALVTAAAAQTMPREVGLWYDDTGKGAVEIVPCGDRLCGRIAWLKDLLNAEGKPLVDRFNPNPARRTTPICGLQVVGGLQAMTGGTWDSGWIYDPKTGSAYDLAIQLSGPDQLKVTGYKGVKLFSKSFTWRRAPDDLPRCNGVPAAGQAAVPPATAKKPVAAAKPATGPAETAKSAGAPKPPAPRPAVNPNKATPKPTNGADAGESLPWAKP